MRLNEVRRWAIGRGVSAVEYQWVYDGALLHAISRLLQAIHRESKITRLFQDARGRWQLNVGRRNIMHAPVSGPLPFGRLDTIGSPWVSAAGKRRRIRTVGAFLISLNRCLAGSKYGPVFAALRSDFENSVANVVLNRLIGRSLSQTACAIEPAYQGHQYYPFPALRRGPDLSQVLECSHLCHEPVNLPLLETGGCRLISCEYGSFESCFRAWSGLQFESQATALLPVHPWQLRLSPLIRELLGAKLATLSRRVIKTIPLASQRTCRVVRTGFDVKLPIDATLTGEHRLLYRLNYENAPVVSALAKHLLRTHTPHTIDFQQDVASIFHSEPGLGTHLSAIIRAPVRALPGEDVVPAINLWTGREEARALLQSADSTRAQEFFHRYCRVLMTGPVQFCSQWGMAFEPHLQNVYVALRDGLPSRIVLRDLDNSVLDARSVRPALRAMGMELAQDTWHHMPAFTIGGRRLVQAMMFGHLGEVMSCLTQSTGTKSEKLISIIDDTWNDLTAGAPSASARKSVIKLRGWSDAVKATLHTRLHRSTTMEFVRA